MSCHVSTHKPEAGWLNDSFLCALHGYPGKLQTREETQSAASVFSTAQQKLISWQNFWTHRHLCASCPVHKHNSHEPYLPIHIQNEESLAHYKWWRMGIRNSQRRRFISRATSYLPRCSNPIPLLPLLRRRWREAPLAFVAVITAKNRRRPTEQSSGIS
jgi:hypothetical protein